MSTATQSSAVGEQTPNEGYGTPAYRAYVLFALIIVYTFNFIDRTLINVLGDQIRETFGISDFMIGMLAGPAFAIMYTVLGIPFAMLAERRSRTWIIGSAMAAWSAMTALCGIAQNSWQFALARIGVGVGEAGCSPPSHSLISDYFPPEKRSSALSIFALGVPLGAMLAALGGAWIASQDTLNWRDAFIWMGLPGILGAVIFKWTVKDPPRGYSDPGGAAALEATERPGLFDAFRVLALKPSFWHVSMAGAVASFASYGIGQFITPFWMRSHGMSLMDAALIFGGVIGLSAGVGTIGVGLLADHLRARHPNSDSWLPAIGMAAAFPIALFGYNTLSFSSGASAVWLAIPALATAALLRSTFLGPMFSVTQKLVEPRMRAVAAAILLFVVNFIGYVFGPPVIGAVSVAGSNWYMSQLESPIKMAECGPLQAELVSAREGKKDALSGDALSEANTLNETYCGPALRVGNRIGISIGTSFFLWSALHFYFLSRTMRNDLWEPDAEPAKA